MACSPVRIRVQGTGIRIRSSQGLPGPPGPPGGASDSIIIVETDETVLAGQVVYAKSNAHLALAQANAAVQTKSLGLALFDTSAGSPLTVQTQDIVTLTTAQWDTVTGETGGLTSGAVYYLSTAVLGQITVTAAVADPPNIRFNSRIGLAITATELNVLIRAPLKL